MQQDLLTELKLPSLDNENLERIVRQNATRLRYLIEAHNIYVKNSELIKSLFVEKKSSSSSSYFSKTPGVTSGKENIVQDTTNITLEKKKKLVECNSSLDDEVECTGKTKKNGNSISTTLVSSLGWDSNDEDENQSSKIRSYPTRFMCETSCSWEPEFSVNESLEVGSNICGESEYLLEVKTESEEIFQAPDLEKSFSEPINVDFTFSRLSNKSVRCYSKRKMTDLPSTSVGGRMEEDIQSIHSENPICRISEVVGNADESFCGIDSDVFKPPPITPKKTNDITKIKGWRRKQFFVENSSLSSSRDKMPEKTIKVEKVEPEIVKTEPEEPTEIQNAFVCDSLDEFLESGAELKVNYEIPHLYAEVGIKLTSEEIASKPNLSVEDFKEVESKYCVPALNNPVKIESDDSKSSVKVLSDSELEILNKQRVVDVKRRLAKSLQKQNNKEKIRNRSLLKNNSNQEAARKKDIVKNFYENFKNVNLAVKLIGLVVDPGPNRVLHPLVRRHLSKLRSYHTKIDENWANFAVSAVVTKSESQSKKILPVFCAGKIGTDSKQLVGSKEQEVRTKMSSGCTNVIKKETESFDEKITLVPEILKESVEKMKSCRVVIDKLKVLDSFRVWCMEHNCYYCFLCGLNKVTRTKTKSELIKKVVNNPKTTNTKGVKETVFVSKTMIDKTIAGLLAKKLKILKSNGDTVTSIDCLKTATPNTVELIKLNFIKQSFLTGYINIWHLKPGKDSGRSRAFLTFSKIPPMPNTINLKSNKFCRKTLPKVITEIISGESTFDPNEYAILHCNGDVWEIHGCLNLRPDKNETVPKKCIKNVEQIFTPNSLPELPQLQRLAEKILGVKLSKWWVLDLSQKFEELSVKSTPTNAFLTRQRFLSFINSGMFGFVFIKKDVQIHSLGAYVFQNLVPFVLIGPYYLSEKHDLTLKTGQNPVCFTYKGEKNSSRECPLKCFINSVLTEYQETGKRVEGLWLYDKTVVDETCYLEVMTTTEELDVPKSSYNIHAEHGYSLNTPQRNISIPASTSNKSGIDSQDVPQKIVVYLYFEISDLGYLQGELLADNGILIHHPLNSRTKVKSLKVGDWFLRLIKRRIRFIPKNLQVRWFITKHKEDLRNRQPFNKFYLGGAHILCKKGLFFMLDLTESKIKELGVDENEVKMAISKSKVINEVRELRSLASILCGNSNTENWSMEQVLVMAINEIQTQKKLKKKLLRKKLEVRENMILNCWRYLREIDFLKVEEKKKFELIEKIKDCFLSDHGELNPDFIQCLISFNFGRKYLFNRSESLENEKTAEEDDLLVLYVKRDHKTPEHKFTKRSLPVLPSTKSPMSTEAVVTPKSNVTLINKGALEVKENVTVPTKQLETSDLNKKIKNNSGVNQSSDTSVLKNENAVLGLSVKKFYSLNEALTTNNFKHNKIKIQKLESIVAKENELSCSDGENVEKLPKRKHEDVEDDEIEVIAEISNHKSKHPRVLVNSSPANGPDLK